ncbi:Zinc transporter 5 [Platanthera guangdongensis]|uniref:Zinc transporter 5 n=1 Tax=Platanthera guangdongensis TaxID=2320717 RepID=A0ABR2LU48_9ASPA
MTIFSFFFVFALLLHPALICGDCGCDDERHDGNRSRSISLKLIAIFAILVASVIGVSLPTLGKWLPALGPEKSIFFAVKAFAAGVILATGFVHILPDAFESLSSPCLNPSPWRDFPFAGFVAMVAAIGTLAVDSVATGYYNRVHHDRENKFIEAADQENGGNTGEVQSVHVHTHAAHGHSHGARSSSREGGGGDLIRRRVISQVLELGIVVHSVIIGISLGASDSPSTIKPLVVALSFHQFFEGMGLGGCLVQAHAHSNVAQFETRNMITMIIFFCMTTPVGIAVGIGISSVYNENSPKALIVEGILNSGASGILIYMALVDLLAADFMNPKVQNNTNLQIVIHISLLLGAGLMSLLAKWA